MIRYAITIFVSAFLLFQVQPLIGKYILPWFGGGPGVWTVCMLFFQLLLLGGYLYAHVLSTRVGPRAQGVVHLALLAVAVLFLPLSVSAAWRPTGAESPTWAILLLLLANVGLLYFLLSTTGPLLQRWFSLTSPGRSPYRLYALSNLGSLLALVTYPFVVEPELKLKTQLIAWSIGYAAFVAFCGWCAVMLARLKKPAGDAATSSQPGAAGPQETSSSQPLQASADPVPASASDPPAQVTPAAEAEPVRPSAGLIVLWLGLAACGCTILLATTNQICQEVAVVPFLWILPLALYLLTFIICFDSENWYIRELFFTAMVAATIGAVVMLYKGVTPRLWMQIGVYSTALFCCCMVCHGELARSKPHPKFLTLFYLMVAAGGALGGIFVALVAPLIFKGYWEYHLALAGCFVLAFAAFWRDRDWFLHRGRPAWAWGILTGGLVALVVILVQHAWHAEGTAVEMSRNFYGVLRVRYDVDASDNTLMFYKLMHGRIDHGLQYTDPEWSRKPTSYYGLNTGIGIALTHHPKRKFRPVEGHALHIGVIGLGTGTTAVYGQRGDHIRFYEINPEVLRISDKYFTYRDDTPAVVDVVIGDARIQMERELERRESQQFDVLVVDAFSSDAIPMHLLTKECFRIYWEHMKPTGIVAIHISNRQLDLSGLVRGLAESCDVPAVCGPDGKSRLQAARFVTSEDSSIKVYSTDWVLVTQNGAFLNDNAVKSEIVAWKESDPAPLVWTDDYGSLRQVLIK